MRPARFAPRFALILLLTCCVQAEQRNAPIVDYGDDIAWNYRGQAGCYRGESFHRIKIIENLDLDHDGSKDDSIGFREFSLDRPFNPIPPNYRLGDCLNTRFFGGHTAYVMNNRRPHMPEGGINVDHGYRDDFNFHAYHFKTTEEAARAYGVWIWKKEDFLNRGDQHPVTFDQRSILALRASRYWRGLEEGRWIVGDGPSLYISETTFAGCNEGLGATHILKPATTRWAPYWPASPYKIDFAAASATFANHTFQNVTAVGFYVAKPTISKTEIWFKWYAFEAHATVSAPPQPSETLAMAAIPAGGAEKRRVPAFTISTTEIPFGTWTRVLRQAESNAWALKPGYVFDRDGDMGSMDCDDKSHDPTEPATDMTWLDAVLWCNALSEREGRMPCYYVDPECKQILRKVKQRDLPSQYDWRPTIHVRWDADGFRLPTVAEWVRACGPVKSPVDDTRSWVKTKARGKTHPVGEFEANALGIYDMIGNVWEYCWDGDSIYEPAGAETHLVLGGGFDLPDDPARAGGSIGLRVIRRDAGLAPPPKITAPKEVPQWQLTRQTALPPAIAAKEALGFEFVKNMVTLPGGRFQRIDEATIELTEFRISKTEIPYSLWKQVRGWGAATGYRFDRDGDMGSMDHGSNLHAPTEPVTDISYYDAVAWCNALSELTGRTPCYYIDQQKTHVYKQSLQYRLPVATPSELRQLKEAGSRDADNIYVKWEADGFRLPTEVEWEYAARAGTDDGEPSQEEIWQQENSRDTTHPVGAKAASRVGLHDMFGNVWEWCYDGASSHLPAPYDYYDVRNPKGLSGNAFSARIVRGGSFVYPDGRWFTPPDRYCCTSFCAYSEIGFRVVCCEEGAHPETEPPIETVFLGDKVDEPVDPLQGRVYKANLARTGEFEATGLPELTGKKWTFKTGGKITGSPVSVDGIVYFGSTDGFFYAVDSIRGEKKWAFPTGHAIQCSPAVVNGLVYFGSDDGHAYALDAITGEIQWKTRFNAGHQIQSPPAVGHGLVFFSFGPWGPRAGIHALVPQTGKSLWRCRDAGAAGGSSGVALADGLLLYSTGSAHNPVVDLRSGRLKVDFVCGNMTKNATPAVRDGVTYNTGSSKKLSACDLRSGRLKWVRVLPAAIFSSPAVDADRVYVGCHDGCLYAVEVTSGQIAWKFKTGKPIQAAPSVASGLVYCGSDDAFLHVVDAASGKLRWKFQTQGPIQSSAYVGNGVVFVASHDGRLYALR